MKNWLLLFLLFSTLSTVAQVHVRGYYRKDGTYVQPHMRSSPDGNPYNNYSFPGNTNPYTGKVATGNPETYLDNYYNRKSTGATSQYNSTYSTVPNSLDYSTSSNSLYEYSAPSSRKRKTNLSRKYPTNEEPIDPYATPNLSTYPPVVSLPSSNKYYYTIREHINRALIYNNQFSEAFIMKVEKILSELGYISYKEVDATINDETIVGIMKFQQSNEIRSDGCLGPKTLSKLMFYF